MIISCIYTYTYNNEMLSNHWLHLMSLFSYLYFLSKNFKKKKLKKKPQKIKTFAIFSEYFDWVYPFLIYIFISGNLY